MQFKQKNRCFPEDQLEFDANGTQRHSNKEAGKSQYITDRKRTRVPLPCWLALSAWQLGIPTLLSPSEQACHTMLAYHFYPTVSYYNAMLLSGWCSACCPKRSHVPTLRRPWLSVRLSYRLWI